MAPKASSSAPYIRGLFPKFVVGVARRTFWRKPSADFELRLSELEAVRREGLVRPMGVLPPVLGDGPTTGT